MNQPLDLRLDKDQFLLWVERQTYRHELVGGRVIMMPGSTKNHARVMAKFIFALIARLDGKKWSVTGGELAVEIGEDIRYPDAMVEPLDDQGMARSTQTPVFLLEVLSPSSIDVDLEDKLAEYTSLASLECYVVANQDRPHARVWQRARDGARTFPAKPDIFEGEDAKLAIAAFGIEIPLSEIY
jgi:Uma2 family endonuclease